MSAEEHEYFSDGITEEIINALTKVVGLKVTARTSSFAFKGKLMDIREIGRQLGVATLLEGSVRIAGQQVRITAQLINVEDGFHYWSQTFDRSMADIFAVQDEISLLIAEKLRELSGHFEIGEHLIEHPGISTEHYQAYLKGRFYVQKFNKPDVELGIRLLEELTQEVPGFVLPYLFINYGYTYLGAIGVMPGSQAFSKGKYYLDAAVALNPDLVDCHLRMGGVSFWVDWDLPKTYQHFQRALELQPGNAEVHLWMGVVLTAERHFAAGMRHLDTALQLDPFSALHLDFKATIYYFQGDYETSIEYFEQALKVDPNFMLSHINRAAANLMLGRLEEGLQQFLDLPPAGELDLSRLGGATLAYAMLDRQEEVRQGLLKLEKAVDSENGDRALFFLIIINAVLGKHDEAVDLIQKGIDQRLSILITLKIEPYFQLLKTHPRFQSLLDQVFAKGEGANLHKVVPKTRGLKRSEAKKYQQALVELMEKNQPYLNPQLSLRDLAKMLDIHPNYLSQLINDELGKNFAEYVNSYRLEAFKAKATDPKSQHLTILGLAYESGFSSKTVFNTFFKKCMGTTPSRYWKKIQSK